MRLFSSAIFDIDIFDVEDTPTVIVPTETGAYARVLPSGATSWAPVVPTGGSLTPIAPSQDPGYTRITP